MILKLDNTGLKDFLLIASLCYNGYLNHLNSKILSKQNLAVIELCDKLSLKIALLEQKSFIKSNEWVSGISNESLIYYYGIAGSLIIGVFFLYYASSYIQESSLYKVTKLVDKSIGVGADNVNSLVDWFSTKPVKEINSETSLPTSNTKQIGFIENNDIVVGNINNKMVESLSLDKSDKMFISFDMSDKNDPLSVALSTGGKNFQTTIHDTPVSGLPLVEQSMEEYLIDTKAMFSKLCYD